MRSSCRLVASEFAAAENVLNMDCEPSRECARVIAATAAAHGRSGSGVPARARRAGPTKGARPAAVLPRSCRLIHSQEERAAAAAGGTARTAPARHASDLTRDRWHAPMRACSTPPPSTCSKPLRTADDDSRQCFSWHQGDDGEAASLRISSPGRCLATRAIAVPDGAFATMKNDHEQARTHAHVLSLCLC